MRYRYTKLTGILFFATTLLFAQQMPINFSDSSDNFIGFSSSNFSTRNNPNDASDTVGQFFNDGTNAWQGFYIDLIRPIDLDVLKTIRLDFYQFDANTHTILLKLELGANPDVEVKVNTNTSGWRNNIQFNFANAVLSSDGTTPVNASGTYGRLTIFIDGGSNISGTYLIDDIDDGSTPTDPNAIDVEYTDLVWADEFNTAGKTPVNATNWFHQTQIPAGGSWFNGEVQHYTNRIENSFVENGNLNIVAIKESFTDQGVTKQYTSARLNSKFAFTYGRVDVRAKLPNEDGTWPAIWTLGKTINEDGGYWDNQGFGTTNWPACGEIDIMEHGLGAVNHTSSAIHTPSSFGNTVNTASQTISDVANNYHIYSMNWSPNQITFLVDGIAYYTYNPSEKNANTWPFDEDQYMLLNVAMGGISGTVDPTFTNSSMIIDYVRVYQNTALDVTDYTHTDFKIYPNPVSNTINIISKNSIENIEIFDMLGHKVLETTQSKTVHIEHLNAGIYVVKIFTNTAIATKRIVIK
ncbi:putative secreted protein (Por secretion system target) [Jejuia pallidilutea]|uniref:Putative secreted protein (Por secretion system target) n=1 Tax=Jejuia pallidilutea TaxID=504487 RepID=A0A362X2G9_9FLAO|nr:family 16 glycosylhydrolase [Jejuia pallidilutea]PQV50422.1 putative secreted protein (Por secretion system target) [Jejuia pallidilutea]